MTDEKICNKCGRVLDIFDIQEDFSIHKENLGYGTKYDTDKLNITLCCSCMEKLIDSCCVSPVEERILEFQAERIRSADKSDIDEIVGLTSVNKHEKRDIETATYIEVKDNSDIGTIITFP